MIDIIEDTRVKATELMEESIQARRSGNIDEATAKYSESVLCLKLLLALKNTECPQ